MAASRSFVATRCPFSKNVVALYSSAEKRSVKHNSVTRFGPWPSDAMVLQSRQHFARPLGARTFYCFHAHLVSCGRGSASLIIPPRDSRRV